MNIGVIGLGKLGLPFATWLTLHGYRVRGYDVEPYAKHYCKYPEAYRFVEAGPNGKGDFRDYLSRHTPEVVSSAGEVYRESDIVFIAVQTPHDPRFDGTHPVIDAPVDFDYGALCAAVQHGAADQQPGQPIVVISTCLPGTMRSRVQPLMGAGVLLYNPFFIAMGTVLADLNRPEFVLLGSDAGVVNELLDRFYAALYGDGDIVRHWLSWESAELSKVAYNTFISMKVGLSNTLSAICEKHPQADVNGVISVISSATNRLLSSKYLQPGMGDGGACHPRDNIAMSWLCEQCNMDWDTFGNVIQWREGYAYYLSYLMTDLQEKHGLPLAIWGYAFKPGTAMTDGSHALLVHNILDMQGHSCELFDPYINPDPPENQARIILVGCGHPAFKDMQAPAGSIVLDPHCSGLLRSDDCSYIAVGAACEA